MISRPPRGSARSGIRSVAHVARPDTRATAADDHHIQINPELHSCLLQRKIADGETVW